MPFNANNPHSLVSQIIRDPMLFLCPPKTEPGRRSYIAKDEAERMAAMYKSGMSQCEISEVTGRSETAIGQHLRRQGIAVRPRPKAKK